MPKFPKPFFRTARRAWYVQLGGKQISLGCDQDAAFRRYHKLMSRPRPQPQRVAGDDVLRVLDAFLGGARRTKPGAPTTGVASTCNPLPGRFPAA
jgi:hypothetical protein